MLFGSAHTWCTSPAGSRHAVCESPSLLTVYTNSSWPARARHASTGVGGAVLRAGRARRVRGWAPGAGSRGGRLSAIPSPRRARRCTPAPPWDSRMAPGCRAHLRVTPAPLPTAQGVAHPAFPKPEPAPQLEPQGARLRQRGRTTPYSASAERGELVDAGEVLQASRCGGREKLCLNGSLSNGAVQSATMADTACKAKRARCRIG
jgi:hypothetical protein